MTKDVVWIGPDIDMVQATRLLLQGNVAAAGGGQWHSSGIITEMDCLRAFLDAISDSYGDVTRGAG